MVKTNLNQFAREVTLTEGLKRNTSIAQVKEILKIVLGKLKTMTLEDLTELLKRIK